MYRKKVFKQAEKSSSTHASLIHTHKHQDLAALFYKEAEGQGTGMSQVKRG